VLTSAFATSTRALRPAAASFAGPDDGRLLAVDSERPTLNVGKRASTLTGADAPMRGKAQARVALTEAPRVLARARRRQLTLRPTAEPTSHRAVVSPGQSRIARTPKHDSDASLGVDARSDGRTGSQGACCSAGARPAEQAAGRADRVAPSHQTGACGGPDRVAALRAEELLGGCVRRGPVSGEGATSARTCGFGS